MTDAKHTPGPWVIDPSWDILGNTSDGNGLVCAITTDGVDMAESAANARLIAAAPELLEALKQLLKQHDGGSEQWAREAIAKAEGRDVHG